MFHTDRTLPKYWRQMEAGSPTSRPKGDEPKSKIDGGTLIVAVGVVDRAKLIIVKASLGGGGSELRYGHISSVSEMDSQMSS